MPKTPKAPRKVKSSEVESAKKEGYKFAGPGEGGKEFYVKPSKEIGKAKSYPGTKTPPSGSTLDRSKDYDNWLIQQLQGGVSPEELVKQGYATPEGIKPFESYYTEETIYTEPEPTVKPPMVLNRGLRIDRKLIEPASTTDFKAYDYPDPNAGYSKATRKYFVGEKEIDPTKSYDVTGKFNPFYLNSPTLNEGVNLGTVKHERAIESKTPLSTDETDETGKASRSGTLQGGGQGNIGFNRGGIVGKVRKGYLEGGKIQAIGQGAAMLGDFGGDIIASKTTDEYGRTNTGSKVGDYAAGYYGGMLSGAGKGAAMGAAGGVPGILIGAGIGGAIGATKGIIKTKQDRESIEGQKRAEEIAKLYEEQAKRDAQFGNNLNNQLQSRMGMKRGGLVQKYRGGGYVDPYNPMTIDPNVRAGIPTEYSEEQMDASLPRWARKRGDNIGGGDGSSLSGSPMFRHGGMINGPGTAKSDSIPAKVKEGSFIVPAENVPVAKEIKKKLLKAPSVKKKANLNQKGGEEVLLSNGEFMFDPKEVKELEKKGVNLDALAPNAEENMNGYGNGGKVKRNKSTGNKEIDAALDEFTKKEYRTPEEVDADMKKLSEIEAKYKALYGKNSGVIQDIRVQYNKVKDYAKTAKYSDSVVKDSDNEYESAIKALKDAGANESELRGYKFNAEGIKRPEKLKEIRENYLSKVKNRVTSENQEELKKELKVQGRGYYGSKLKEAENRLAIAKSRPNQFTSEQIKALQSDVEEKRKSLSDAESAIKDAGTGGSKLIAEVEKYRKSQKDGDKKLSVPKVGEKKQQAAEGSGVQNNQTADSEKKYEIPSMSGWQATAAANQQSAIAPKPNSIGKGAMSTVSKRKEGFTPNITEEDYSKTAPAKTEAEAQAAKKADSENQASYDRDKKEAESRNIQTKSGRSFDPNHLALGQGLLTGIGSLMTSRKQRDNALKFLKESGSRPQYSIPQDFQDSINRAQQEAQYGFSGEEQSLINQENANALASGRFAARNYSGGSAANAFNMERAAINESFGRGLKARIADKQLKLTKQQRADDLVSQKMDVNRQVFNDNLNAWEQNQMAGAQLLKTATQDMYDTRRYFDTVAALQQARNIQNSWTNSLSGNLDY